MTTIFRILIVLTITALNSSAVAKLNKQESSRQVVNPGKVEGYGPVSFKMDATEALRASGKYGKYESYEVSEGDQRWLIRYYTHDHIVYVHLKKDDTISHLIIKLHSYSEGLMPRGECYSSQFDVFAKEFSEMFPNLSYNDVNEIHASKVVESKSRVALFSDGSKVLLKVYFIDNFAACNGDVWLIPSGHF